jgi:hypothetical protein
MPLVFELCKIDDMHTRISNLHFLLVKVSHKTIDVSSKRRWSFETRRGRATEESLRAKHRGQSRLGYPKRLSPLEFQQM